MLSAQLQVHVLKKPNDDLKQSLSNRASLIFPGDCNPYGLF